jgi:hypothetical protein
VQQDDLRRRVVLDEWHSCAGTQDRAAHIDKLDDRNAVVFRLTGMQENVKETFIRS